MPLTPTGSCIREIQNTASDSISEESMIVKTIAPDQVCVLIFKYLPHRRTKSPVTKMNLCRPLDQM